MTVLLVYSTGRCGTQFLQTFFKRNLGDRAVVEHEPIGADYAPRRALRHPDLTALRREMPAVDRHLDRIAEIVSAGKIYVETGWPAFAWLPLFKRLFGADFRYVHVVRNPLYFAYSMFSHDFYNLEKRNDSYVRLAALEPGDPGILHQEVAADWPEMTPYEKCLFQWLEINQYARHLTRSGLAPAATVLFEKLFSGSPDGLRRVYRALDAGEPLSLELRHVDIHRRRIREAAKILAGRRLFSAVEAAAGHFGYEKRDLELDVLGPKLARRYAGLSRCTGAIKRRLQRAAARFLRA